MVELLISWYLANTVGFIEPHQQYGPSCTIASVVECQYRETGVLEDSKEIRTNSPRDGKEGAYTINVMKRLEKSGGIKDWNHISRREAKKQLINGGNLLARIVSYKEDGWNLIKRDDGYLNSHLACVVGYIDGWYVLRNTWGEHNGLNGYYLASEEVTRIFYDVSFN